MTTYRLPRASLLERDAQDIAQRHAADMDGLDEQFGALVDEVAPPEPEPMSFGYDLGGGDAESMDPFAFELPKRETSTPKRPAPGQSADDDNEPVPWSGGGGSTDGAPTPSGGGWTPGPSSLVVPDDPGKRSVMRAAAAEYGVDPSIFERQLAQEGAFSADVWAGSRQSSAGARGPGQFMPGTAAGVAAQMGVSLDQFWASPELQVRGAAKHMADLLKANGGDYARALAAYNAGQGNVNQYGGVPPFEETQTYVRNILGGGQAPPVASRAVSPAVDAALPGDVRGRDRAETGGDGAPVVGQEEPLAETPGPLEPGDFEIPNPSRQPLAPVIPGGYGRPAGFDSSAYGRLDRAITGQQPIDDAQGGTVVEPGDFELPVRGLGESGIGNDPSAYSSAPPTAQEPVSDSGIPSPVESPPAPEPSVWEKVGTAIRDALGLGPRDEPGPDFSQPTTVERQGDVARQYGQETTGETGNPLEMAGAAYNAVEPFTATGIVREGLGRDRQIWENRDDEQALTGLLTQLDEAEASGDTETAQALRADIQPIMDRLNTAYRESPVEASERNPYTPAVTTAVNLGQGAAAGIIAPSIGAGLARNAAAAVIDPQGQAFGTGMELAGRGVGAVARNLPASGAAQAAITQGEAPATSVLQSVGTSAARGAVAQGVLAADEEDATPESIATRAAQGALIGAGNRAVSRSVPLGSRAGEMVSRAVRQQQAAPSPTPPWAPLYDDAPAKAPSLTEGLGKVEGARRMFVRAWTDDRVDLAELQREAQQSLGRPLTADEMVTELSRRNPMAAADAELRNGPLREAIQAVGPEHQNTLNEVLTYRDNLDVAAATGNPDRKFSGDLTAAESRERLAWLEQNTDPETWRRLNQAAGTIHEWVDSYRQRMVDSGVWSQDLADELQRRYPHYVPTRILDYMKDPQHVGVGRSLSLRDRGLRENTIEGTTRARETPLASLVRYAQEAESIIQRNETFNAFVKLSEAAPDVIPLREVPSSYSPTNAEKLITGFVDGVRKQYVTSPPIAAAVQMEGATQLPVVRDVTRLFRELITRSPVFVAGQVPMDAMSYIMRTSAREGGPQTAPRVAAELVRAYADAFKGIGSGRYEGDLQRFLKEGAGMAGMYDRSAQAMRTTVDDLTRQNMVEVNSPKDVARLLKWVATFEWSQAVGQRVEMAPRLAAGRMAEQRALNAGADADTAALRGAMDFRDVTLDFQRGGTWARTMNQIVPFFNVGWQSAATVARAMRENPVAFPMTVGALIGAPTIAAEAWNRSDPQRARDYDDVPDYVKDRGIVVMLPGEPGEDAQGNRRPNYALVPLRELAPFAILARETAAKAMYGEDTRGWGALIGAGIGAASPIQASGPADLFNSVNPIGISTGLQLSVNKDLFRQRDIATERGDEEASNIAKGIAGHVIPSVGRWIGQYWEPRPSQVEFGIRDLTGHAGASALAAGDLATGRERPKTGGVQDLPLIGGLAKRFVGNAVGQRLQDARGEMISPEVRQALRDAGMRDDELSGVKATANGVPLTREAQAEAQSLMNDYLEREIAATMRSNEYRNPRADREKLIREAATRARRLATEKVLSRMPPAQRKAS